MREEILIHYVLGACFMCSPTTSICAFSTRKGKDEEEGEKGEWHAMYRDEGVGYRGVESRRKGVACNSRRQAHTGSKMTLILSLSGQGVFA